jgi:catechol 2,3-dioxygenase-like lactoylglutathione lyase family enzyme
MTSDDETLAPPPREAASFARGIEHLGITVPDVLAASDYLTRVFGAEFLYDLVVPEPGGFEPSPSDELIDLIGVVAGTSVVRIRVLRVANGPNLELFEFASPEQREPARPNDYGLQHFAVLVEDIDAAGARVREAGGRTLAGPNLLPGLEEADDSYYRYTLAPWGSIIELVQVRGPQAYERLQTSRRWRPAE